MEKEKIIYRPRIGDYFTITGKEHPHYKRCGKCVDSANNGSHVLIEESNGYKVWAYDYEVTPMFGKRKMEVQVSREEIEGEIAREAMDLLDAGSSFDRDVKHELQLAHESRARSYKKSAQAAREIIPVINNVDRLLKLRQEERDNDVADNLEEGLGFKPDYIKIGGTTVMQALNITQLISGLLAGGIFAPLAVCAFCVFLYGNYYVLQNNLIGTK